MKKFLLIFSFFLFLFGETNASNISKETNNSISLKTIQFLKNNLSQNEFYIKYLSYLHYKKLENQLKKYRYLARRNPKYKEKYESIKTELELLKQNKDIFKTMINLEEIPPPPTINNPFEIFNAISYEKKLKNIIDTNKLNYNNFLNTYEKLKKLYEEEQKAKIKDNMLLKALNDFEMIKNVYETKLDSIVSQANIYKSEIEEQIKKEINKLITLAILIALSILFFTFIKFVIKKYVKDESVYIANKIINFINLSVIIVIISFFYINNATYLITILGFASAGIAIAMKDWFMNIFGWFVIMTSGSFKVGDRIKIYMQNGNVKIVGDVIDITLTKIVIYEDVTLTTYLYNRRAGRIVFIPNNIIFTQPVFNYTHYGLSTVWDGIDITITFDSNYKKAVYLAKEIVNKYSKGYTDITKRRIKKLKNFYNIKTSNVEPRIFTFIEENGIRISCWYLNNYAPLNLRSTISAEILDAFNKEEDINIAYPTYTIIKREDEKLSETQIPL